MNLIATKKGSAEHPCPIHGQLADKPDPERNSLRSAAISLHAVIPPAHPASAWLTRIAPVLDRLLGIRTLDRIYHRHHLQGLTPFEFAEQALDALDIALSPAGAIQDIPARGPLLVVCNHPYGGVEALALMHTLRSVRTDIKFLANTGLQVFRELQPHFIATNPLRVTQKNLSSIRQCEAHLTGGGVLVMFPAGKVSTRPRGGTRIADAPWNRLVGHLAHRTGAALLPVFFHGANSRLFHALGGVWERSKLLMLPREFLRLRGQRVRFEVGRAIPADVWRHLDTNTLTHYARVMTYLLEALPASACVPAVAAPAPLTPLGDPARIAAELAALPGAQRLLDYKQFGARLPQLSGNPVVPDSICRPSRHACAASTAKARTCPSCSSTITSSGRGFTASASIPISTIRPACCCPSTWTPCQ
jgi:putative hemolysin